MGEAEPANMAVLSRRIIEESFSDITWEGSQVGDDEKSVIWTFCIYGATGKGRVASTPPCCVVTGSTASTTWPATSTRRRRADSGGFGNPGAADGVQRP